MVTLEIIDDKINSYIYGDYSEDRAFENQIVVSKDKFNIDDKKYYYVKNGELFFDEELRKKIKQEEFKQKQQEIEIKKQEAVHKIAKEKEIKDLKEQVAILNEMLLEMMGDEE